MDSFNMVLSFLFQCISDTYFQIGRDFSHEVQSAKNNYIKLQDLFGF